MRCCCAPGTTAVGVSMSPGVFRQIDQLEIIHRDYKLHVGSTSFSISQVVSFDVESRFHFFLRFYQIKVND